MENTRLEKGIRLVYLVFGIASAGILIWTIVLYLMILDVLPMPYRMGDGIIVWFFQYPILSVAAGVVPLVMGLILRKRGPVSFWVSGGILLPPVVVLLLRAVLGIIITTVEFHPVFMLLYVVVQGEMLVKYGIFLGKNWQIKKELSP